MCSIVEETIQLKCLVHNATIGCYLLDPMAMDVPMVYFHPGKYQLHLHEMVTSQHPVVVVHGMKKEEEWLLIMSFSP